MTVNNNDIFHVHTFRCKHADNIPDIKYIEKALVFNAPGIWFTDHAPFPGDPFRNRMEYSGLNEYISSLYELKQIFADKINVHIGLEIEYFPSFDKNGYYKELLSDERVELLLLGQHMAEVSPGCYTFSWDKERLGNEEYIALGDAQIQGINSGYFGAVAHPDRIFRRQKKWSEKLDSMSNLIITAAYSNDIPLEINAASQRHSHQYWKEFWDKTGNVKTIYGLDAHSLDDLDRVYKERIDSGKAIH